jgi:nucleoside-diphosphate-sugar epimerase
MAVPGVLVVGANGFIGPHLVRSLEEAGIEYVAIPGPRSPDGVDLGDRPALRRRLERCEFSRIAYLAGAPDRAFGVEDLVTVSRANLLGFANLLAEVAARAVSRFVFLGSYKQYGDNPCPFLETMTTRPNSTYAFSKDFCEKALEGFSRISSTRYVSLRLSTVYGPGQSDPALLIPGTIAKCLAGEEVRLTEGKQRRELTYVQDVCDAIILALDGDVEGPVNIGAGESPSVREIVECIHSLTGSKSQLRFGAIPYRPNEVWEMSADSTIARTRMGWQPKHGLRGGIMKTIEGWRGLSA